MQYTAKPPAAGRRCATGSGPAGPRLATLGPFHLHLLLPLLLAALAVATQQDTQRTDHLGQQVAAGGPRTATGGQQVHYNDLKHDTVHKLMSSNDLRRTFQVDSHDQVPEYEILKLTVRRDGSHLISPISDLGEITQHHNQYQYHHDRHRRRQQQQRAATSGSLRLDSLHSDRPAEQQAATLSASRRSKRSASDRGEVQDFDRTAQASAKTKQDAKPEPGAPQAEQQVRAGDKLIVMNLSTFGRDFKLRLKRNSDFQQRIKNMKMFMAESTKDGQLRYTEIKPQVAQQQQQYRQVSSSALRGINRSGLSG